MTIKVEVIQWDKPHINHIPHPRLRAYLERLVGTNLEDYIYSIIVQVCLKIGLPATEADTFWVNVLPDQNPNVAFSFKTSRDTKDGLPHMMDMLIGFCGDLTEFRRSIIHETLHVLDWDEKMVRKKTEGILNENTCPGL